MNTRVEVLRARYSAEPVPPCRVCGGELEIQRAGGGEATRYGCPRPEGIRYSEWREHYGASLWTQYRPGDSDVLALIAAFTATVEQIEALRPDVSAKAHPPGDESLVPNMIRRRALNDAARIVRAVISEPCP